MQSNHYRYFQKNFSGYNIGYLLSDSGIAANVNLVRPGTYAEPTGQNYAQLVFQVGSVQTVTANITIIGSTDYSTKVSQVIQITPSTEPYDSGSPSLASQVTVPIYLNTIESIISDQPLNNLYIGYYSQFGLYTSDGAITSHVVSLLPNVSGNPPATYDQANWSLLGSIYQFSQPYSPNPPARNFYPFNADTNNQTASSQYLTYIHQPVGKYKLLVNPTDVTDGGSANVLWEVGFRNYL